MKRRVLVVDDDRHMVRTISDVLRLRGWEVDGAYSGEEAVEAVGKTPYRALVMDIRMAGMNGVEAFRAIRGIAPALPVVFMTAYSATELLREAERLGALRIFAKPFPIHELVSTLENVLVQQRSVLLVDDNLEFLATLRAVLVSRGVPTLQASSLDDALRLLEAEHPGVVILDLKLAEVDPRDAILAVRRVSPAVALILYSGHPDLLQATTAEFPAHWFSACFKKPFHPEQLLETLDALTGN